MEEWQIGLLFLGGMNLMLVVRVWQLLRKLRRLEQIQAQSPSTLGTKPQ